MSPRFRPFALLAAGALISPLAAAQDSVSKISCAGGDSTSPYDDAITGLNGSELCDDFVVNLNHFETRWGVDYGIAPLLKSSKSSIAFNSSLISAQALSRVQRTGVTTAKTYSEWSGAGFGVNNNPAIHDAGTPVSAVGALNQFGVAFAEFGTTDAGFNYNGVVGATVLFHPANPGRLYVSKVSAAINGSTPAENTAAIGLGSVDEDGNVFFRADGFGATGGVGITNLPGDNIFSVDMLARDCDVLNVISDDTPGKKDTGALSQYVFNDLLDPHSTPTALPPTLNASGTSHYMGLNFRTEYLEGTPGGATATGGYLAVADGVNGSRGNLSYTQDNFGLLGSSAGMGGHLGTTASGTNALNVFGVDASGSVTGTLGCVIPGSVTDNDDGFTTLGPAGTLEFDHYGSQVAFNGGNGQVSMRVDQNGDLLIAAVVNHPTDPSNDHPINAIAVCKVDGTTGAESWTLAGWNDGVTGKAIKDGPGGATIGNLIPLFTVTGGAPVGPSMSSPMIDSVGNIYFLSALHTNAGLGDDATGLVRAVYDPANFSYELDLVMKTGDIFTGGNSGLDYLVTFLGIADGNSVSSGAAWSQNISDVAHASIDPSGLDTNDSRALGGLVISAGIIYDVNGDGDFTDCGDFGVDEDYNVLLYIGDDGWENAGKAKARANGTESVLDIWGPATGGSDVNLELRNMEPGQSLFLIFGFSEVCVPFKFGTLYPSPDIIFPALPTLAGELALSSPWPAGIPAGFESYWQAWITGPSINFNFSATNGVRGVTP